MLNHSQLATWESCEISVSLAYYSFVIGLKSVVHTIQFNLPWCLGNQAYTALLTSEAIFIQLNELGISILLCWFCSWLFMVLPSLFTFESCKICDHWDWLTWLWTAESEDERVVREFAVLLDAYESYLDKVRFLYFLALESIVSRWSLIDSIISLFFRVATPLECQPYQRGIIFLLGFVEKIVIYIKNTGRQNQPTCLLNSGSWEWKLL